MRTALAIACIACLTFLPHGVVAQDADAFVAVSAGYSGWGQPSDVYVLSEGEHSDGLIAGTVGVFLIPEFALALRTTVTGPALPYWSATVVGELVFNVTPWTFGISPGLGLGSLSVDLAGDTRVATGVLIENAFAGTYRVAADIDLGLQLRMGMLVAGRKISAQRCELTVDCDPSKSAGGLIVTSSFAVLLRFLI